MKMKRSSCTILAAILAACLVFPVGALASAEADYELPADAPDHSETYTLDGVETDEADGALVTETEINPVYYAKSGETHYFRQALYVDETGVVAEKSVTAAITGGTVTDEAADGVTIISEGKEFNGIYVCGGSYIISNANFDFTGNGGNDFAGYGSAIMATGADTTLVVENTNVCTEGVIRTTLTPADGANVIVKNSRLDANEGVLPEDYTPNTSLGYMKSVPWMLGLYGNCRATNMLGSGTQETFINSVVTAGGWGVLSVDDCSAVKLTGINSTFATTGISGYGCYGIGSAIDRFYGCNFDVATYAAIMTGAGSVYFGDSTQENVTALNEELSLGLTENELSAIEPAGCHLVTGGAAIMIFDASGGSAEVGGSTVIEAGRACFLTRSGVASITVDGAEGAQLSSDIGVILQMIDLDKANRENTQINGVTYTVYPGPYTEPYASYEEVEPSASADMTIPGEKDVTAYFANIELTGDFYNGTTGTPTVQNLDLTLDNAAVTGVISASFAQHEKNELYPDDWSLIGVVENTVCPAVNNGVLLTMTNGAVWNVTGDSYLTNLVIEAGCAVNGVMTVDGVETPLEPGTYTGHILVSSPV